MNYEEGIKCFRSVISNNVQKAENILSGDSPRTSTVFARLGRSCDLEKKKKKRWVLSLCIVLLNADLKPISKAFLPLALSLCRSSLSQRHPQVSKTIHIVPMSFAQLCAPKFSWSKREHLQNYVEMMTLDALLNLLLDTSH